MRMTGRGCWRTPVTSRGLSKPEVVKQSGVCIGTVVWWLAPVRESSRCRDMSDGVYRLSEDVHGSVTHVIIGRHNCLEHCQY
jgi:hypothetical protein